MNGEESYMRVTGQLADGNRFQVKVELYSNIKRNAISHQLLDLDSFGSFEECARTVEAAGGALAEHQNLTLGDNHDPSTCAKVAKELLADLLMGDDVGIRH
jgi:hypothetical protein